MKWYFGIDSFGALKFSPYIKASVISCRENTSLTPICLWHDHDGYQNDDLIAFLRKYDVKVIKRQSRVYSTALHYRSINVDKGTAGTHMRYDIPLVEMEDEFVLYTDCDVIFQGEVDLSDQRPKFFAAAPEFQQETWHYFNSGVMLMNIPEMRRTSDALLSATISRMQCGFPVMHDQADLNGFYFEQWDKLSPLYNWKPYWGINHEAKIVHFHGPKPAEVWTLLQGGHKDEMSDILVRQDQNGYREYMTSFLKYLKNGGYEFIINTDAHVGFCVEITEAS